MATMKMPMAVGTGSDVKAATGVIKSTDWNGTSTSSTVSVTGLGFKPKHVSIFGNGTYKSAYVYDENVSTTKYSGAQGSVGVDFQDMTSNNYYNQFSSIDSDGFTLIRYASGYSANDIYWAAFG